MSDETPLADRPLTRPAFTRLPADHPGRDEILDAHAHALQEGEAMYVDPRTGLSVLTARWLADRGTCCGRGCRHCPYTEDVPGGPAGPGTAGHPSA